MKVLLDTHVWLCWGGNDAEMFVATADTAIRRYHRVPQIWAG